MPHNIVYRPALIDQLITPERMHSYQRVFVNADDAALVGAYLWNAHVCAALYPLVQLVEVSLRNAMDYALSSHHCRLWWARGRLKYASFQKGGREPVIIQKIRANFARAANTARADKKERYGIHAHPAHAEIVAKTDFATWEWMLDSEFYGQSLFWPRCLPDVFRGCWEGKSGSALLTHARDQVRSIRTFRNRMFHHEPAWKKFGVVSQADAVAHLQERVDQLSKFLALIHPNLNILATKRHLLAGARRACAFGELQRFQYKAREHRIRTKREIKSLVRSCARANESAIANTLRAGQPFLIIPLVE